MAIAVIQHADCTCIFSHSHFIVIYYCPTSSMNFILWTAIFPGSQVSICLSHWLNYKSRSYPAQTFRFILWIYNGCYNFRKLIVFQAMLFALFNVISWTPLSAFLKQKDSEVDSCVMTWWIRSRYLYTHKIQKFIVWKFISFKVNMYMFLQSIIERIRHPLCRPRR